MNFIRLILFFSLAWITGNAFSEEAEDPDIHKAQMSVINAIDKYHQTNTKIAQQIWDWAELGYLETRSSKLLQSRLKDHGFAIEAGVAEIPTAFVASYGSTEPVIAFLAEFDALPGISQDDSPVRTVIENKTAGHACGHHLLGTGAVAAALAVKSWLSASGNAGTVRVYGTPAEEGGSGKVYMVRAGLFDDVDIVLDWHPSDHNSANLSPNLANRSAKFRFTGAAAHAAGAPDRGRSALDGVEAMNMMVNMMREHIPQESRIHYVITSGGEAPNVVPAYAEVYYYLRHPEPNVLIDDIWNRVVLAAEGAALGTGTKVTHEIMHGNRNLLVNEYLQKLAHRILTKHGGVKYSKTEQNFAKTIYASFKKPKRKLGSQMKILPFEEKQAYGSTDVGDVSWTAPTARFRIASWVPGTSAHSWQAVAAGGTSIGYKGMKSAASVLAATAVEIFLKPEHVKAAQAEFKRRRGPDFKYRAMLGDRDPPLNLRVPHHPR